MLAINVHGPIYFCECLVNSKALDMICMLAYLKDKEQACFAPN